LARARGQLEQASEPHARAARFDARKKLVVVELDSGALFAFPPHLAQRLGGARPADLAEIELSPAGTGLYWPRLGVDLSVQGLLAGVFGGRWWTREAAARAGRATSPAKAAAARANGSKGGRPRKSAAG
jgi:hypothetical protein